MKYQLYIPFTNNLDYLIRALNSIQQVSDHVTIVNNSGSELGRASGSYMGSEVLNMSPAPLSFAQIMNEIRARAIRNRLDAVFFMHGDGEVLEGRIQEFVDLVCSIDLRDPSWGMVFSHYDVLCAFNPLALQFTGEWDINIRQYMSDNDYYGRMLKWGFHKYNTPFGKYVFHQGQASSTVKSDAHYRWTTELVRGYEQDYYRRKWGSLPAIGNDAFQYDLPFNGNMAESILHTARSGREYPLLAELFHDGEGNLLELNSGKTQLAQITLLTELLRALKPERVLEIGTNKGMFGLLLKNVCPSVRLFTTFDGHKESGKVPGILGGDWVQFIRGDSRDTVSRLEIGDRPYDFAWVDGGHGEDVASCDIMNMWRLKIPVIALDDCRGMPFVDQVISRTGYREIQNPYWKQDDRGIRIFCWNRRVSCE